MNQSDASRSSSPQAVEIVELNPQTQLHCFPDGSAVIHHHTKEHHAVIPLLGLLNRLPPSIDPKTRNRLKYQLP